MSVPTVSTDMADIAPAELVRTFPSPVHDSNETVGYEGLLVEDIKDVINILLDHASITPHKDFVLRLGQRLCPSQLESHKVVTDQGVEFVGHHALAESYKDFVIVDEDFFDCMKGSIFCCEGVLTLGPD